MKNANKVFLIILGMLIMKIVDGNFKTVAMSRDSQFYGGLSNVKGTPFEIEILKVLIWKIWLFH